VVLLRQRLDGSRGPDALGKSPEVEIRTRVGRVAAQGEAMCVPCCMCRTLTADGTCAIETFRPAISSHGGEEPLVLGAGPVGDPQASRAAQRCARPDRDPSLGQRLDDLSPLQRSPSSIQANSPGTQAVLIPSSCRAPSTKNRSIRFLSARSTTSSDGESPRRPLPAPIEFDAEWLPYRVDRRRGSAASRARSRRACRRAPWVLLKVRSRTTIRVARQQIHRRVRVVVGLVLDVGLVDDDRRPPTARSRRSPVRSAPPAGACRVGLLGLQTIRSCVAAVTSSSIASRSWMYPSASGTRISRAPERAGRCGYIENDGQA